LRHNREAPIVPGLNDPLSLPSSQSSPNTLRSPRSTTSPRDQESARGLVSSGIVQEVIGANNLTILSNITYAASLSERPKVLVVADKWAKYVKPTEKDVPQDHNGLQALMNAGSWRAALRLTQLLVTGTVQHPPHVVLQFKMCRIFAYIKLRLYKNATEELSALGNLDEMTHQYESYPSLYPGLQGSFVPFAFRLLHAELPSYSGNVQQTLDLLYHLLSKCREQVLAAVPEGAPLPAAAAFSGLSPALLDKVFGPPPALPSSIEFDEMFPPTAWSPAPEALRNDVDSWRHRENWVMFHIVAHLIQQKEYTLGIGLFEEMLQRFPTDIVLLSCMGRFYLQIGHLVHAERFFDKVDNLATGRERTVVGELNRGLLLVAQGKHVEAIGRFQAVLQVEPYHVAATNNQAICLLYSCQLIKAMHVLEDLIQADPVRHINESVVFNLCSLYDLYSDMNVDKKTTLMKLVAQFASDGFDQSMLKLPFANQ